jgi:hypothetical protein
MLTAERLSTELLSREEHIQRDYHNIRGRLLYRAKDRPLCSFWVLALVIKFGRRLKTSLVATALWSIFSARTS